MLATPMTVSALFSDLSIYVIPTFQRPYAWEEEQWNELIEDIQNAAKKTPPYDYHYFAPLHVIKVDPTDELWERYVDQTCPDIHSLKSENFRDKDFQQLSVFLVVDGQQRLATLYSLLHVIISHANFINLAGGSQIPRVILNPPSDHDRFRSLLGISSSILPHTPVYSHSEERLVELFEYMAGKFALGGREHLFLTGNHCQTLRIELPPTARLVSFMSLNDRGKDLSTLEKSKSLFMEFDENYPDPASGPRPSVINNAFGDLYRSVEAVNSYIDDNEFLRQTGMMIWESPGSSIHNIGPDTIYKEFFKKLPNNPAGPAGAFIHSQVIPSITDIRNGHNHLIDMIVQTKMGTAIGVPSFTSTLGLGFSAKDAIEDYFSVLLSLKLQTKQIGFLLAVRKLGLNLHDPLGNYLINNVKIKLSLTAELAKIRQEIRQEDKYVSEISNLVDQIEKEIEVIPDTIDRPYTALQIAEALRIFVGTAQPGRFSIAWQAFRTPGITPSIIVNKWIYYVIGGNSRDVFIIYRIAQGTDAFNNNSWVPYLLKEYEDLKNKTALPGCNAHRNTGFEIEHFFAKSFGDSKRAGFDSLEQFQQSFVEQIGNKLVLDQSLNRALQPIPSPIDKIPCYDCQCNSSISVMVSNPSYSSLEIASDLGATASLADCRVYVRLRSLRLAAFAARRF